MVEISTEAQTLSTNQGENRSGRLLYSNPLLIQNYIFEYPRMKLYHINKYEYSFTFQLYKLIIFTDKN